MSAEVTRGIDYGCAFCFNPISVEDVDDPDQIYREVASWVTGPKLQSPVLRRQTGNMAHRKCVENLLNGQAPDQEPIPGMEEII